MTNLLQDIGRISKYLFLKDQFSALFLQSIQKEECTTIPLAAVSFNQKSMEIKLLINPTKWNELNDATKEACLIHEENHLTNFHFYDLKPNSKLDNICADISVNQGIKNLPEWACFYEDYKQQFPQLAWEPLKGKNFYYNLLNSLTEEEKQKAGLSDEATHIWDIIPEALKEAVKANIESLIEQTAKSMEAGKVPSRINDLIKDFVKPTPVFDYRKYLRNQIQQATKYLIKKTRSKENPRIETEPKLIMLPKQKILVLQDQSGSVSNEGLKTFNNEIYHLSKKIEVDAFSFDTEIGDKIIFSKDGATRNKSGGTDIQCCLDFYSSHKEYNFCIIYTDGHFSPRKEINKQYLIVIDQAGTTNNVMNHRNVIKIPV